MYAHTFARARAVFALLAALAAAGCDKSITSSESLPAATGAAVDADAGTWKMLVMTGPTQIAVAPPSPVGAADYQAELTQIKDLQRNLTPEQRAVIDYWSG